MIPIGDSAKISLVEVADTAEQGVTLVPLRRLRYANSIAVTV